MSPKHDDAVCGGPFMTSARWKPGPELVCERGAEITHDVYDRIAPGIYLAYCRAARVYWDPQFKRWTCLLRWDALNEGGMRVLGRVAQWLSFGKAKNRDSNKPHASRRASYWREWNRANGAPPSRADRLSPSVFTKRMATVEVRDVNSPSP